MFKLDFIDIMRNLLPPFLRRKKRMAYLTAALKPVMELHSSKMASIDTADNFTALRKDTLERISYTSRVAELERALNIEFNSKYKPNDLEWTNGLPYDNPLKRNSGIYIETMESNMLYIYNHREDNPNLGKACSLTPYLFSNTEINDTLSAYPLSPSKWLPYTYLNNRSEYLDATKITFVVRVGDIMKLDMKYFNLEVLSIDMEDFKSIIDNDNINEYHFNTLFLPIIRYLKSFVNRYKLMGMVYKIKFDQMPEMSKEYEKMLLSAIFED